MNADKVRDNVPGLAILAPFAPTLSALICVHLWSNTLLAIWADAALTGTPTLGVQPPWRRRVDNVDTRRR
jgi:hypothetical protein